ncbi:MAG TPA: ribosome maturation factor RimM [Nitrospiria bacterium]|nr:ribosome maturation factor RimM [Nitrospiria bacterium]
MRSSSEERASLDDWVVIGEITKPFGLKGGLKIRPLTEDPGRFRRLAGAVLEAVDGTRQTCTIDEVRTDRDSVVLFCREIETVEQVERFVGGTVRIPGSEAIRLPQGSYFQHDLVGLQVYLEDGRYLGVIREIWPTGGNDVLVVRDGERERLIPAIKSIVIAVDLTEKRMVLRWMEGLLDL